VDSVRFSILVRALEKPLKAQVKAADVIIINKIDEVDDLVIRDIEKTLRDLRVSGSIVAASGTEGTNLDKVVDLLVK
jgi:G3E family GTPase